MQKNLIFTSFLFFVYVKLCFVLDTLPVFVNIRRPFVHDEPKNVAGINELTSVEQKWCNNNLRLCFLT